MQGVNVVDSVKDVNLQTGIAAVNVEADTQYDAVDMLPQLVEAVTQAGYRAEPYFGDQPQPLDSDTIVDP